MAAEVVTVRAHHFVCLAHHAVFGGEDPTLPDLLAALRENPDRDVRVVVGPEDVCEPCPHWNGTQCTRREGMEERNRIKDEGFLAVLGLTDGDVKSARELHEIIAGRVTVNVLMERCPTCSPEQCARSALAPWLDAGRDRSTSATPSRRGSTEDRVPHVKP